MSLPRKLSTRVSVYNCKYVHREQWTESKLCGNIYATTTLVFTTPIWCTLTQTTCNSSGYLDGAYRFILAPEDNRQTHVHTHRVLLHYYICAQYTQNVHVHVHMHTTLSHYRLPMFTMSLYGHSKETLPYSGLTRRRGKTSNRFRSMPHTTANYPPEHSNARVYYRFGINLACLFLFKSITRNYLQQVY